MLYTVPDESSLTKACPAPAEQAISTRHVLESRRSNQESHAQSSCAQIRHLLLLLLLLRFSEDLWFIITLACVGYNFKIRLVDIFVTHKETLVYKGH